MPRTPWSRGSGAWFAVALLAMIAVWGLDPKATTSPDEAVNRQAAGLVAEHGSPRMALPFDDPEDLAHPRSWVSVGKYAIPSYAPVSIYWYAPWLRLGALGLLLITAIPASAAAALVAGSAKLLPEGRKWLSLLAPLLAAPATYWLLRPWMNLSLLLSCLCWAFFFWASWRSGASSRHLDYAAAAIGAAAAVRPDYAAYLFLAVLLFGLGFGAEYRKRVILLVGVAGSAAVLVNLALNVLVTGHPLVAAYQIEIARSEGVETTAPASSGAGPLHLLEQLLAPMGVPSVATARYFLAKYWLHLSSVPGLLLAQLTLFPMLRQKPLATRVLYGLSLLVMFCFLLSRMDPGLHGASEKASMLHHSIPRYWTPVYLLAGLPPLLFIGAVRSRVHFTAGAALLVALASASLYDIVAGSKWSLVNLHAYQQRSAELVTSIKKLVPTEAMIYTSTYDKVLWRRWRLATLDAPGPSATSIERALGAQFDVFVYEPTLTRRELNDLKRALRRRGAVLEELGPRGLFHVARR